MPLADTVLGAASTISGALGGGGLGGATVFHVTLDITIGGKNVTKLFPPVNTIALRYEDCLNFKSDNLEIICPDVNDVLINSSLIKKGVILNVKIHQWNKNYPGEHVMLDCGAFEIDIIEQTGPPTELRLSGTSIPISGTLKLTPVSQLWQKTTLKAIHSTIATRNKLKPVWDAPESSNYSIGRLQQNQESDLHFITRVCESKGLGCKVTPQQTLVVFNEQDYELRKPVATLDFKKPSTWGLKKWKLTSQSQDVYASAEVSSTNPLSGDTSSGEYGPDPKDTSGSGEKAKSTKPAVVTEPETDKDQGKN
jgi:hypothetical protein